jgi:RimJ/RimL family protein N-acetyltransferase
MFPGAFTHTVDMLTTAPADAAWWTYLFVEHDGDALLGSGGYKGPPHDGWVEIGYELAPEFRGRGLATAAARALVAQAFEDARVDHVRAHTLQSPNPSTAVLERCGFVRVPADDQRDDALGVIEAWTLARPASLAAHA